MIVNILNKKTFVPLITNSRTFRWELDLFFATFDDVITTGGLFSTKDYLLGPIKTFQNPSIRDIAIPVVGVRVFINIDNVGISYVLGLIKLKHTIGWRVSDGSANETLLSTLKIADN